MVKKYLPFIILAVGAFVLVLVFLIIRKGSTKTENALEENVAEIAFDKRAVASLTPSEDGHWLKLRVDKLLAGAKTLDYELLYTLPDGRTQGVPGSVNISGLASLDRSLLLGSESSGKFRYDEGVEKGTLTLKFRDDKGKLLGKLSTGFYLQSDVSSLSSVDGKFKYEFDKKPKSGFFIVMETFGVPIPINNPANGPYGVFSSSKENMPGKVTLEGSNVSFLKDNSWVRLTDGRSSDIGIFVSSN
jgi:hypothetical protein